MISVFGTNIYGNELLGPSDGGFRTNGALSFDFYRLETEAKKSETFSTQMKKQKNVIEFIFNYTKINRFSRISSKQRILNFKFIFLKICINYF